MRGFDYYIPTRLLFGAGRLGELGDQKLPGKKAFVAMSSGKSLKANGWLAKLEGELRRGGADVVVYDKVRPNPTVRQVMEGATELKAAGCDFVVGFGGGSAMDAAKAIAFAATNPGDLWDYSSSMTGGKKDRVADPLPIVCVTTTAGTGSEIDPWGVITREETNEKSGFFSGDSMYPVLSVVDPDLMMTVPPELTAFQGMDAFFHASESVINAKNHLMGEMFALKAVELIAANLPTAVRHGDDKEARGRVALANTLAGFYMRCTSAHSLEHALGGAHPNLPHGAGLIIIAHAYYEFFASRKACEGQMVKMARAMGVEGASSGEDFVRALDRLIEGCGVANLRMSDYGVRREELAALPAIARRIGGGDISADPIPLSDEDFLAIYEKSYR